MKFGFFPAYFDHPSNMRFAEQEADESIELLLRQHWFVNVSWIFFSILASFLPFLLLFSQQLFGVDLLLTVPPSLITAILILWYLLITAYVLENFLFWYFNIYIVTNQHLVDINFENILNRSVVEAGLEKVESAYYDNKGIIRSLFNYGNVIVQTAAESQQITFYAVPYPNLVVDRINDLRVTFRE